MSATQKKVFGTWYLSGPSGYEVSHQYGEFIRKNLNPETDRVINTQFVQTAVTEQEWQNRTRTYYMHSVLVTYEKMVAIEEPAPTTTAGDIADEEIE